MTVPPRRGLFVGTILAGSFLLFLVQPLVARMALPRLGGAPNVWNSAMLVYQALLLGGYLYAHALGRLTLRRQAQLHLALLGVAALTLPISLFPLAPPAPGSEAWWVPLLLALTIGPVFLLVSAQAPLMQRWFAAAPGAGNPYPLYAASNLGSFAGLIAYPLLAEPLLPLRAQSRWWSAGYGLLLVLVAVAAWSRRVVADASAIAAEARSPAPDWRRIALWLALSAVPSGLMLSTTTHLTTDVFAMPLLWVIPLGLYLLSFTVAFSERALAWPFVMLAPLMVMLAGSLSMMPAGTATMSAALAGLVLLFDVSVTLHARLYALRPEPDRLTLFYLVLSVGGVLGGLLCALIAPLLFDWTWEHPLLVLAAAALLPLPAWLDWRRVPDLQAGMVAIATATLFGFGLFCAWLVFTAYGDEAPALLGWVGAMGLAMCGLGLMAWRWLYLLLLLAGMLALGGWQTVRDSMDGLRARSYFGVYTVREDPAHHLRTLAHGTTLHGQQFTDPARRLMPGTYYGPGSAVGIVLANAPRLASPAARIGVVGLGAGTLACYARPGQSWRFFEIDPLVLAYSRTRRFTYLADCAPQARVTIGDARLELARVPPASFDVLAIDAFTSDAIPLHLLTQEALGVYFRALAPGGVLLVHISNRHIDLAPVLGAEAARSGVLAVERLDNPADRTLYSPSDWILLTRSRATLDKVRAFAPQAQWQPLEADAARPWTDDHASVLPHVRWSSLMSH